MAACALIETGDLDGDLDHDLVVGCRLDESLVSYENNGMGGLVRRTGSHVLDSRPTSLRIADLDEDGRGDVVVGPRRQGPIRDLPEHRALEPPVRPVGARDTGSPGFRDHRRERRRRFRPAGAR
ncbi:MAG: VCBS repeat-containing protein [bacterium]|nr:VCBS repeat-containing protein [bacterium]